MRYCKVHCDVDNVFLWAITLTPWHQYVYSPHFSWHFSCGKVLEEFRICLTIKYFCCWQSFPFATLMFGSEVTLIEEIKWKSLLRLLLKMLMWFIVQCSCIIVWMSVSRNANLPSKNFINFAVKMAHWIQKDMNTVKHSANCRLEWLCWNRN